MDYQKLQAYYTKITLVRVKICIGILEIRGVAGGRDVRVAQYCIQEYICYVKCSLFTVSGPICVAIISLYGIVSNRFLCKINTCCCKMFTVER